MEGGDNPSLSNSLFKSLKNKFSSSPIVNIKNSDTNIFFINSFHKEILEKSNIFIYGKNIDKITPQYTSEELFPNYIPKIYCISFQKEIKLPKTIKLSISFWSNIVCEIYELNIKDNNNKFIKFIFNDIKINDKQLTTIFIRNAGNHIDNIIFNKDNYFLPLNFEEKLDIYINYMEKYNFEDEEKKIEYQENLVSDFIYIFKKNNLKKINFSCLVKLLYLSYENNMLIPFLDFSNEIIYIKNDFQNDFFLELIFSHYLNLKEE